MPINFLQRLIIALISTADLDLNDRFRQNVVADWLAYFEIVKVKHCLQEKKEHFQQATRDATLGMLQAVQNPTHWGQKAVLNATQEVGPIDALSRGQCTKKAENRRISALPLSAALCERR